MIKIFTVLMSLHLIIAPVAYAQSTGGTSGTSTTGSTAGGGDGTGSAGDQFRQNPDGKKSANYMDQISSVAITAIGTTAMLSCKFATLLPSITVFNAGSLVYIASEIMGGKAQNAFHNRKVEDLKMVEEKMKGKQGGEVQKEALETALKDEKETLAIINKRKKWLGAVSMIYTVATILAIVETIKALNPLIPPLGQIAACDGSMIALSLPVKIAVVGAWSFAPMKSGSGMIGKYGSMAAALAMAIPAVGGTMTGLLNPPAGRIAAFAIATALIRRNQSHLSRQAQVAEENIKKLENVLAQFNNDTQTTNSSISKDVADSGTTSGASGGVSGGATSGGAIGNVSDSSGLRNDAISGLPSVSSDMSKNCWSNGATGPEYSTNCNNPTKLARPQFEVELNVPTLRNGANLALDMSDAVARGDIAKADAAASSLEAMSGKLKNIQDDLLKKANDELKAKSQNTIDLDAEKAKALAQIQNSIIGQANSQGMDLASLAPADLEDLKKNDEEKSLDVNGASTSAVVALPETMKPINEGLSNQDIVSEGDVAKAPSLEESLNDFESSEDDISNRPEDSIFKQVSSRYQANYSRFFKRKEPLKEEAPAKP